MKVKICGITRPEDAAVAVESGADAVGFILYPRSPRYVDPQRAWAIARELPPFVTRVAVCVNLSICDIIRIERVAPFDAWQLHGDEEPDVAQALLPRRIIKVFRLGEGDAPDVAEWQGNSSAFLLDTPGPGYGGTGRTFDWQSAADFRATSPRPVILSGGLGPHNAAEAIRTVQPYAVDVSSGVEEVPGRKDHAKVRDFVAACKGALEKARSGL
ncbi:phosphoribosylanthranilate isomerase [Verrucomicrobia bacterium LW23]|nr:phosphoribosylanthranilate isomerase [Verrucomicrobia bacterium LW23]